MKLAAALALLMAAASAEAAPPAASCKMEAADRAWIDQALANWRTVAREKLRLKPSPLPTIVTFDGACSYVAPGGRGGPPRWEAAPHQGSIRLPDGKQIPAGVVSFAGPGEGKSHGFFVMSLPSVWRAGGVQSPMGLERLMDGVLLHELMHTWQFYFVNPRLAELTRRYKLPDDINDDSLQAAFKDNPAYVKDYERERDLLFAAAATPSHADARRLAGEALAAMRARRARWFTGAAEQWGPLDEIFLTMEGLGQWAIYSWVTDRRGGGLSREAALEQVRRGGRWWSQDQGLALFLTIDRLVPSWQKRAFAPKPETAEALLARATR